MLLFCFCCAVLPIPYDVSLISPVETHGSSDEPFPCQGCGCGCKTAEQCWTGCCCFTPSQRIAWAKANGVKPPDYAVLVDSDDSRSVENDRRISGQHATGSHGFDQWILKLVQKTNASVKDDGSKARSCCESKSTCTSCKKHDSCSSCKSGVKSPQLANLKPKAKKSSRTASSAKRYALSMLALKCQGKSSLFSQLPWLVSSEHLEPLKYLDAFERISTPTAAPLVSAFDPPDTPPPRIISA